MTLRRGHTSYITCAAISDTFVITGSADHTMRKWDMTTCDCLHVYEGGYMSLRWRSRTLTILYAKIIMRSSLA